MTQTPKIGALSVVVHNSHVLLVKRKNEPDAGLWGFPGGHVELGETALDAAARELREETGVIADPVGYLTNVDAIERGADGEVRFHFLLASVLCAYVSGEPDAQDDVSAAEWWPVETVLSGALDCSAHVDTVLKLALSR